MSYILDALKKADAQRERDPARGIHARPAAVPAAAGGGTGGQPWVWAVSAGLLVALLAAGWYLMDERPATPPTMPTGAVPAAPPTVAATPAAPRAAVATAAPPVSAVPRAASEPPVAAAVLPPPAAPRVEPDDEEAQPSHAQRRARARATAAPSAAPAPAAATGPVAAASAATAVPAPPSPAVAKASTAAAVPVKAPQAAMVSGGLPPDAPKLAISGGVYSTNAAQRMLIVNGQVVNEGADLGSGLVLDEIRPKAAVVRYRGARYTVTF